MFVIKNILKSQKNLNHLTKTKFTNFTKFKFSEVIPSSNSHEENTLLKVSRNLDELILKNSNHTKEEIAVSQKLGADLYLNQEKLQVIENSGFYFNELDNKLNFKSIGSKNWRYKYLENMCLIEEYDDLFREFLQNCAKCDTFGIDLNCEPRLAEMIKIKLRELKKFSFNLEVNTIKIRQNHKLLRMEILKNINIDRSQNEDFSRLSFSKVNTGLANMVVANQKGEDYSFAQKQKPFILACTMLVQSPMRLAIFNQNLSKEFKLRDEDVLDYVVRFETQMTYSDFTWILPTQNKPSRLKFTKITDFNNILRGNPYFLESFDLENSEKRFDYMSKDVKSDEEALSYLRDRSSKGY
jgi:hypothetical protein